MSCMLTVLALLISSAPPSSCSVPQVLGYGRFGCTLVNGDGTFSPDPTQCQAGNLVAPGSNTAGTGTQGDRPLPVRPTCFEEYENGTYWCGIGDAPCSSAKNCDNGPCVDGRCQGGIAQPCFHRDTNCSGFLYCLSSDFSSTPTNTCGGIGAFCQDSTQGAVSNSDAENYAIFNQFCSSGYCNFGTANCDTHGTTVGADCSSDPQFYCSQTSTGQALTCDAATSTCVLAAVPSSRARSRFARRASTCPFGHSLCPVGLEGGVECIDTSSNLESCGGCPGQGGVDCSALAGVSASSCVDSVCEIWACLDSHVWSAEDQACVAL
ncbi:hypothetical protein JCM11491_004285 [Sporobolomyces phaffii]